MEKYKLLTLYLFRLKKVKLLPINLKVNVLTVEALKDIFWNSLHTLRYGLGEVLYGHDEITAFRNSQRGTKLEREVTRLVVTTYGRDFATANCETKRTGADIKSRQSHTWVRQPEGWRIVAAHVSAPGT